MALVSVAELLRKAEEGGYAVGAFNTNNMELAQAIVRAAEAENSPVIMQASQGAIAYAGLDYIVALARVAAAGSAVPIALHLDHGTNLDQVYRCVENGFTSVMYDGSKLSLDQNIANTRGVVEYAHARGVSVEGELGKIGGTEDDVTVSAREALFTDPAEAEEYVRATGVDSLAIAIGTAHGQYKGEPQLDFSRLETIRQRTGIAIVLHGSSGVPDAALRRAIELGVRKINIDTNIREAFVWALRRAAAQNPDELDPRKLLGPAREAAEAVIREKIRIFGSSGKA